MSHNDNDINDDEIRIIRPENNRRPLRDSQPPLGMLDDEEEDEDKSSQTGEDEEVCYYRDMPSGPIRRSKVIPQQSFDEDVVSPKRRWRRFIWPIVIILVCLGVVRLCTYIMPSPQQAHADKFASVSETGDALAESPTARNAPASKNGYVSVVDKKVGDWSFKILYPHNAVPTLAVGKNTLDEAASAVLITHAADVRAVHGTGTCPVLPGAQAQCGDSKEQGSNRSYVITQNKNNGELQNQFSVIFMRALIFRAVPCMLRGGVQED